MYRVLLFSGLTALSLSAFCAAEDYPAANFEPQVIYQAEAQASTQAVEYPAASFTPQVLFQDPELIEATAPQVKSSSSVAAMQAAQTPSAQETPKASLQSSSGAISDVTPPYAALGLAVAAIALAFGWSSRREESKVLEAQDPVLVQGGGLDQDAQEAEEQDLEELALEVEQTLATTNRQRAGKTKRTRRR